MQEDTRDMGSIPGLGQSPGVGSGKPLQYFCLKNSIDRGTWRAVIYLLFGSVVGPALTFRIRHNEQNLSLADVTQQAGNYFFTPALVV